MTKHVPLIALSLLILLAAIGSAVATTTLTDGLVYYFAFNNGTAINSVAGNNNFSESPGAHPDDFSYALNGDGFVGNGATHNWYSAQPTASYQLNSDSYTWCAWEFGWDQGSDSFYQMYGPQIEARGYPDGYYVTDFGNTLFSSSFDQSVWHQVCILEDPINGLQIYTDGIFDGSNSNIYSPSDPDNQIEFGVVGLEFNALDEVGMWNRTLSADEIQQLYSFNVNGTSYPFQSSDTERPSVTNPQPQQQPFFTGNTASVNASMTDNIAVTIARVIITYPNLTITTFNLSLLNGTIYGTTFQFPTNGTFIFKFNATDAAGNSNDTTTTTILVNATPTPPAPPSPITGFGIMSPACAASVSNMLGAVAAAIFALMVVAGIVGVHFVNTKESDSSGKVLLVLLASIAILVALTFFLGC